MNEGNDEEIFIGIDDIKQSQEAKKIALNFQRRLFQMTDETSQQFTYDENAYKIKDNLSKQQRYLISHTWQKVKKFGLERLALCIFKDFLHKVPYAVQLFSFKNEKDIFSSSKFQLQTFKMMYCFSRIVEKIDNLKAMYAFLNKLGQDHASYGVIPKYYIRLQESFNKTLRFILRSDYSSDLEKAWDLVF